MTYQHQVQSMLLQWQRNHFTQANDTPFASEYWRQRLQDEDVQTAILSGSFPTMSDLPVEANDIFQKMKKDERVQIIPDHTTIHDFRAFLTKVKETKSSSPSGRHYGHYKVLLGQDEKYLKVIHGILQMALHKSIILGRWKKNNNYFTGEEKRYPLHSKI